LKQLSDGEVARGIWFQICGAVEFGFCSGNIQKRLASRMDQILQGCQTELQAK